MSVPFRPRSKYCKIHLLHFWLSDSVAKSGSKLSYKLMNKAFRICLIARPHKGSWHVSNGIVKEKCNVQNVFNGYFLSVRQLQSFYQKTKAKFVMKVIKIFRLSISHSKEMMLIFIELKSVKHLKVLSLRL